MKQENRKTGRLGEDLAAKHLEGKGFTVLTRNFATKFGEIDIIVKKGGVLVFVEVKTKRGEGFGSPEEMVGRNKIQRVKRMAQVYLDGEEVACRIDVVAIVLGSDNRVVRITHYENLI